MAKKIIFLTIQVTVFILLTTNACTNNIIPKAKMTNILLEMHIADEVRGNSFHMASGRVDSISLYGPIFSKHGYTIDEFNNSINYYANKPEIMSEMYKDILKQLENDYKKYSELLGEERDLQNLWRGADSLVVETDSAYTKFGFDIPVNEKGIYTFTADIHIFENDSTYNPKMTAWFTSSTNPDTIVKKQTIRIAKNKSHKYSLRLELTDADTSITKIKGYFIDYDSITPGALQHANIKYIYIERTQRIERGILPVLDEPL